MSLASNQQQLDQLKQEEKYMRSIVSVLKDHLRRLEVEKLQLNYTIDTEKCLLTQETKSDELESQQEVESPQEPKTENDINAIPLSLDLNCLYDEDDEEEEEEDDEESEDLRSFLNQLSQQEQNKT